MSTLQLSNSPLATPPNASPWDLQVDGNKNIMVASGPLALAQDVASAIMTSTSVKPARARPFTAAPPSTGSPDEGAARSCPGRSNSRRPAP